MSHTANSMMEALWKIFDDKTRDQIGDVMSAPAKYKTAWTEEKRESKWKVGITLSVGKETRFGTNSWVYQLVPLKDPQIPELYALYSAFTVENKEIFPTAMEYGTIADGSIPGGLMLGHMSSMIPNEGDTRKLLESPLGELLNRDAILSKQLGELPQHIKEGNYEFTVPRLFMVVPWGRNTIVSVRSALPLKNIRYVRLLQEKKHEISILGPDLKCLPSVVDLLKRTLHYVKHAGCDQPTYGQLLFPSIRLAWLLAMEIRNRELTKA